MNDQGEHSGNRFWMGWLTAATVVMTLFGLALVVAPDLAREGFSLLVYSSSEQISGFGPEAADYVELAHAVMGSVMVGWGVALLLVLRGPMRRSPAEGVRIFAISLLCWFVPDIAFSLISGFWQNAVLNLVFALLFAVPLAALAIRPRTAAGASEPR
ncbi:MAG: hypothetical protein ACKOK7_08275 [Solirubrobacterales bacterium]